LTTPPYQPPEPFRCDARDAGDTVYVELAGELDIDTVETVREQLEALHTAGHTRVVLDLRGLDFMDSTGLRLVIEWDALARLDGFAFAVIPGTGPVPRLFRLSGVEGHITVVDG
jgi:anti-sigma B factor antagonist